MAHFIQNLLDQYGYYVLGISLMLELLALPLPGEVLMTYAGLMVFQGHLNWILSILTAGLGASFGMTLSYWIGFKLGTPFFEKYGSKIHLGPDKLKKTSLWFKRYGNKLIIIAFFIPGVRHFTGYFSGVTRMPFRTYMVYAYIGAFIWTGTFISLGKILGPKWEQFHHTITKYLLITGILAVVIFIVVYVYKKYRFQLHDVTVGGLNKGVKTFHSLGRVKFLVLVSFGVFLTLFILMAALVQDFLANEFADFDALTSYIVHAIFDDSWVEWMNRFAYLASYQVLLTIAALSLIWIVIKGKDRFLEAGFLLFVIVGGEIWDEGVRRLFHRTGPKNLLDTFPSEQTLITIIFLGFAAYLMVRHVSVTWVRTGAILLVLAVSFLVGISRIYFDIQYPSDVVAGYVFGGVWLSLNILLLEIFRFIRNNKMNFST
ncbi:VTT domain-containing protein [Paenibacillus alginolyticus]|uniref:VTT domain-containing protein n=1 Tax=Paenibacillus alginolyticus TaxID=59839 RepID=A0ABT4G5P3_9BACL|nr:VTT domain-containing protein [Paenibacillus alginolyticus]MCY9691473.1 VTT domain-containing protein [Paenibacillus alginolyticus]MEC0146583.1 VTT domain-containing protein [Paenibacillus alginolyticus]